MFNEESGVPRHANNPTPIPSKPLHPQKLTLQQGLPYAAEPEYFDRWRLLFSIQYI